MLRKTQKENSMQSEHSSNTNYCSVEEARKALQESLNGKPEGDGWFTVGEMCDSLGKPRSTIYAQMELGVRNGTVEIWDRANPITGKPFTIHYRIIKNG